MPSHRLLMLRRFFQDYKQLEGKSVEVDDMSPRRGPILFWRTRCIATASSGARAFTERRVKIPALKIRLDLRPCIIQ